jgi:hypothetical protein
MPFTQEGTVSDSSEVDNIDVPNKRQIKAQSKELEAQQKTLKSIYVAKTKLAQKILDKYPGLAAAIFIAVYDTSEACNIG